MDSALLFLKLGGSLITDKAAARTARRDVLRRIAGEIAQARKAEPSLRLVLGHGSGSFGHSEAVRHGTAAGVRSAQDWRGFCEVWQAADALNRIVMDGMAEAGLPVIRFAPSAAAVMEDGELSWFSVEPIQKALDAGLIPMVFGDVVFDRLRGGGIASTETVFASLASALHPEKILLAGSDPGVYADYPAGRTVLPRLCAGDWEATRSGVRGSAHADVTGGMRSKVRGMLALIQREDNLRAFVFSGVEEGAIRRALLGEEVAGTWLEK